MKEKERNRDIVKEAIGDPAFYNDQIDKAKEPVKARMGRKTGMEHKGNGNSGSTLK